MKYFPPKPTRIAYDGGTFKELDNNPAWIAEPKINGIRAVAFGKRLFSRHGRLLTQEFKEREWLRDDCEFDCEFVAKNGVIRLYIFDIMMVKDEDISRKPLRERKNILLNVLKDAEINKVPIVLPWIIKDKIKYYQDCLKQGYEGIVLKKLESPYDKFYTESKEIVTWLKVKPRWDGFKGGYVWNKEAK
jgi:ATP-dependent DNA ligase